jgi:predicted RecB family nuclease
MFMSPAYAKFLRAVKDSGHNPPCMEIDPELFFPETWAEARDAKKICSTCPVQKDCLSYALETNQSDGIWGGLTLEERRRLRGLGRGRRQAG